jgi:NADH dehydrogenase
LSEVPPAELKPPVRGDEKRILIAGGTGFVGMRLRRSLLGNRVRILARSTDGARRLTGEDVEFIDADLRDSDRLGEAVDNCWAVINLVAIIEERSGSTFDSVIRQGTENLVQAARNAGVERFVQISALGTREERKYAYFHAKFQAEEAVKASGLNWTILRPSIVFGPGDGFISRLADVVKRAPVIPILGSGKSLFQPISVFDLGDAIAGTLTRSDTAGQTFDLAGPDTLTLREMMDLVAKKLGRSQPHFPVPIPVMKAVLLLSKPLPASLRPPITREQLKMLDIDNATADSGTALLIGRPPRSLAEGIDYILTERKRS